jgi:hypothetical protein
MADPTPVAAEDEILPYLEQAIAWQHQTAAIEPTLGSARESLLKNSLAQASANALKFSFSFARTQAQLVDKTSADTGAVDQDSDKAHLQNAAIKLAQHVSDLQNQIAALTDQIHNAKAGDRAALQARLNDLNGQVKLATAQQDLIGHLLGVFNSMVSSANTGLEGKIDSLSDSETQPESPAAKQAANSDANSIPSGGLLQVSGNLFKLWRQINQLHTLEDGANSLRKTNKAFLDRLRQELKAAIKQGAAIGTIPPTQQTAQSPASATTPPAPDQKDEAAKDAPAYTPPANLDALLADFKQLSAAIVPVTETNMALDTSIHTLDEWQQTVRDEIETLLRRLAIRLAVLGALILIPVIIADLARRATERYVKDDKRQKQLRAVRRSLLTLAIVIIVILNLVTEVGSFATFAGFIVGGLAVAFQNVLLSLVAFFFFYGRYSVRAGDRVSVSGVIGDVVHVGALRFYVRELQDKEGKLEPTGRIAAFPNSILFQTSAFFKYM